MALIEINFSSESLERHTNVYIIKPDKIDNKNLKVLYLLHGYNGDYTNWVRFSNIEKYVSTHNLLVVMPSGYNGFYIDQPGYEQFFTYLTKELPKVIYNTFNFQPERNNTFIAGLSMGGYGAIKAGLSCPELYSKAVGLSSVISLKDLLDKSVGQRKMKLAKYLGDNIKQEDDLYYLSIQTLNKVELYLVCGTEDFLYNDNNQFHNHLKKINYRHQYVTLPGNHSWQFWDQEIAKALKWLLS